jgi:hypothetical protein
VPFPAHWRISPEVICLTVRCMPAGASVPSRISCCRRSCRGEDARVEPDRGVRLPTSIPVVGKTAYVAAVGEAEMIADPRRKPQQDEGDGDKRLRQEEALDEALKNTFPASDPVSVEQPTTPGRARRS